MNDRHALHTKAMMLRSRLDVDYKSPVDIFSLALSISNLTLVFYPFTSHISGMCIKNDGCPSLPPTPQYLWEECVFVGS